MTYPVVTNVMRYASFLVLCLLVHCVSAQSLSSQSLLVSSTIKEVREQVLKTCSTDSVSGETLKKIICSGEIHFGIRTNYKSFGELDGDKNVGFEVDLARQIARELGVHPIFVSVGPADRIAVLLEKKVDVVLATMAHTSARAAVVEFVRPHYYSSGTSVVGSRSSDVESLRDLAAKPICVPLGSYANMLIAQAQARLLIFDRPVRMVDALRYGACALIAHDESLLHASVTGPKAPEALRDKYEKKFSFADVPWGLAVRREDAASLGRLLGLILANFHVEGVLIDLARKNGVSDDFLLQQQKLWREPHCISSSGDVNPACFLPAANLTEPETRIAQRVAIFQTWLATAADIKLTFPMMTGKISLELFLRGMVVSLGVVVLSIFSTLLFSVLLFQMMVSQARPVRIFGRLSVITLANSPTILLLVLGYLIATSFVVYGLGIAIFISVLAIGANNGANGAQALSEVNRLKPGEKKITDLAINAKVQLRACVINAAKTSPVAAFIGTPELLSSLTNIASFTGEKFATYWFVTLFYIAVVQAVVLLSAYVVDRKYR